MVNAKVPLEVLKIYRSIIYLPTPTVAIKEKNKKTCL